MDNKSIKLYCGWTPPLLFLINSGLALILSIISGILLISLAIIVIRNKAKKEKILNKNFKRNLLWFLVFVLYIISTFLFNSEIYYIFSFLIFSFLLLVNLGIAKRCNLYKVRSFYWIIIIFLLVFFIFIFVLKFQDIKNEINRDMTRFKEKLELKKIMHELPSVPDVREKDKNHLMTYLTNRSIDDVYNYYLENIDTNKWTKYDEFIYDAEKHENSLFWGTKKSSRELYYHNKDYTYIKIDIVDHSGSSSYVSIIKTETRCPGHNNCATSIYPPGEIRNPLGGCSENMQIY